MKMEQTECSETSAYKIQTPGNYPEENIKHTEQGESLKSRICLIEIRNSVHHLMNQINQPTRCRSLTSLLLDVYVWFNMFRAPPRPSSGAYNCVSSLWFYRWSVAVAALLVVVWPARPRPTMLLPLRSKVKPEVVNVFVSSWWWAWRRPKHVERHINVK